MTPAERLRAEETRVQSETGQYIHPYRLAELMKIAQRITDILTKSITCTSYAECNLVLQIVSRAIEAATGEE